MSIHDGHRKRTKQEFLLRPDSFPDHRLLEVYLYFANPRGDTNPLAHELMDRFGSISGVLDALPEELMKVPGVGEQTVCLLKAGKELAGRYLTSRTSMEDIVTSTRSVYPLLRPYFFGARNERVAVLCLDAKNRVLGIRPIGEGCVNTAEVTVRKVVEAALSLNASQVILAHNHVSELALPSEADKATTRRLWRVLRDVGVLLADHVIFSDDDMVSMRDSGVRFEER